MTEWDLLNWQTLIIELIIAGIMAISLSIFFYRRQEAERKRIDRIILEQENFDRKRARFATWYIKGELQIGKGFVNLTDTFHVDGEKAHDHMIWLMSNAENTFKNIITLLGMYGDVLDTVLVRDLIAVSTIVREYCNSFNPKIRNEEELSRINARIDEVSNSLPNYDNEFDAQ